MTNILALFTTREGYEEVPLRDRKSDLYGLHNTDDEPKKAEFVADVIAMANTARRYNRPAYLLLGIDDKTNVCGLDQWLQPYGYPDKDLANVWENVRRRFTDNITKYVEPYIECDLIGGEVDGKLVASLVIGPQATLRPFRLKKPLRNKKGNLLGIDSCWIRRGESKSLVQIRDLTAGDPDWYSYLERPALWPTKWMRYFEQLMALPDLMDANHIPGYLELSVSAQQVSLRSCLNDFLDSSHERLFVVVGEAGCGKTSFIERTAYSLADEGSSAVKAIMDREEYSSPEGWIPVYFPLRGDGSNFRTEPELRKELLYKCNQSGQFWSETPEHPEWLFENAELSWLLILDGLDEILDEKGQREFLGSLRSLLNRFPRVKVVLTTRPMAVSPDQTIGPARIVEVAPLSEAEIRTYVTSVTEIGVANLALNTLQGHPDLWKLCSRPSYLVAAMRELGGTDELPPRDIATVQDSVDAEIDSPEVNTEFPTGMLPLSKQVRPIATHDLVLSDILTTEADEAPRSEDRDFALPPRTGQVVDKIYSYLWERERTRREIHRLRADEWKEHTGDLALAIDSTQKGFRRQTLREYVRDYEAELWLLNLGILTQPPGTHYLFRFLTELTQAYFAATVLSSHLAAGESELLKNRFAKCHSRFRSQLRGILIDISNRDVSNILDQ